MDDDWHIYMLDPDTFGIERNGIIFARVPKDCIEHAREMVGAANKSLEEQQR